MRLCLDFTPIMILDSWMKHTLSSHIKHFTMRCYQKIANAWVVTVTPLHIRIIIHFPQHHNTESTYSKCSYICLYVYKKQTKLCLFLMWLKYKPIFYFFLHFQLVSFPDFSLNELKCLGARLSKTIARGPCTFYWENYFKRMDGADIQSQPGGDIIKNPFCQVLIMQDLISADVGRSD